MVIFNECRIDKEGKNLIVDAKVDSLTYYKNVYLESITIDTDETFVENGPSSNPIYTKNFSTSDESEITYSGAIASDGVFEIDATETNGLKNIRLKLSAKELGLSNLNDNMLFVYIGVGGVPDPSTPCGMDNKYTVGVAVNLRPVYNMAMGYIRELGSTCNTPRGFIDMILRLKALELSLKTGNYLTAIKWWKKLFKDKGSIVSTRKCNCNGIYP